MAVSRHLLSLLVVAVALPGHSREATGPLDAVRSVRWDADWAFVAAGPRGRDLARQIPLAMPKVAVSTGLTPLKGFPGLLAASGGSGTLDPTGLPNLAQDGVPADAALLVSDSLGRRLLGSELWLPRKILATAYRDAEGDVHVEGAYVRDEPSPFPAAAPLRCLDVCPPDLLAMACARLTDRSLAGLAGPIAWMPLSRWA